MCGIAGIVNFGSKKENIPLLVRQMTTAMKHRGPNAEEFYHSSDVCLGHRRLSIIDLSTSANQPFADNTGRYHIIFNGEIYNFKKIKAELADYQFVTDGDTEVLLAAYIKWGPGCLDKLEGMFSFAITEEHSNNLFIARDRVGVKPLYYFIDHNNFIFASEIGGMLASGLVPKKVNKIAIKEFLSFQSVGSNISIIDEVFQLSAGCYLVFDNNKPKITRYWDGAKKLNEFDYGDKNQVQERTRKLLLESVEKRLVSDVPIGAFLSGGIDSSAVVGLMAECQSAPVNTFTIGFNEVEFDESEYASIISKKFNTNHTRVLLEPTSFLDELENALSAMDTPSGDGVNTYVVSKAIKKSGLTVALSGIGGDELFAGYPFFDQYLKLRKFKNTWPVIKSLAPAILFGSRLSGKSSGDKLANILAVKSCNIENLYHEFRRIISPQTLRVLTSIDTFTETPQEKDLKNISEQLDSFPELSQVTIAELQGYTQHTLLKDTDQMSMAVSLEVREPFFDHKLIEYVLGIPDSYKKTSYPKQLLVESLNGLLPDEVVFRTKKGFVLPWKDWIKSSLESFCESRLKKISQRDFIKGDELLERWNRFLKGDQSIRWMEIWLFVILENWLEKNEL